MAQGHSGRVGYLNLGVTGDRDLWQRLVDTLLDLDPAVKPTQAQARELLHTAQGHRTVVTLAGELDVSSVDEVRSLLTDVIRATPMVDIERAGLTFIDSTILGALIAAHHDATASGGSLTLLNPAGHVRRVLIVTGVLPLLGPEKLGSVGPETR